MEGIKEQQSQIEQQKDAIEDMQAMMDECCNQNLNKMGGNGNGNEKQPIDITLLPPKTSELGGANPNPFGTEVNIPFFISAEVGTALVECRDIFGRVLKSQEITDKGYNSFAVQTGSLPNGTYLYSLIIDRQVIDTKKMVKSN